MHTIRVCRQQWYLSKRLRGSRIGRIRMDNLLWQMRYFGLLLFLGIISADRARADNMIKKWMDEVFCQLQHCNQCTRDLAERSATEDSAHMLVDTPSKTLTTTLSLCRFPFSSSQVAPFFLHHPDLLKLSSVRAEQRRLVEPCLCRSRVVLPCNLCEYKPRRVATLHARSRHSFFDASGNV